MTVMLKCLSLSLLNRAEKVSIPHWHIISIIKDVREKDKAECFISMYQKAQRSNEYVKTTTAIFLTAPFICYCLVLYTFEKTHTLDFQQSPVNHVLTLNQTNHLVTNDLLSLSAFFIMNPFT